MSKRVSEDRQRVEALFRHGLEAAQAGQRARARCYFRAVLELDPAHERAWLWRAGLTDDPQESLACLARVLSLKPGNQEARKGIRWARRRLVAQQARSSTPASVPPQRRSDDFRRGLALAFGLVLLALALIAFLGYPEAPQMALAIFQPTATATATATPTATSTATATPTATSTATFTPTATSPPPPPQTRPRRPHTPAGGSTSISPTRGWWLTRGKGRSIGLSFRRGCPARPP